MALNGINLPLAFTGQEYVWHKVWRHFGLAEADMDFTGPAFLAWNRMGNIRNWASPLPSDWRESQRDLARQILAMTRAYGMTNVLPCFGGHVPGALRTLFPSANITAAPIVRTTTFCNVALTYGTSGTTSTAATTRSCSTPPTRCSIRSARGSSTSSCLSLARTTCARSPHSLLRSQRSE